jgi:hypothetical protein
LVAVCPACRGVKHLGRSYVEGRGDEAVDQLTAVHGSSAERAKAYAGLVLEIWKLRNACLSALDPSWLAGLDVATPRDT